jgi:hypothetical protein
MRWNKKPSETNKEVFFVVHRNGTHKTNLVHHFCMHHLLEGKINITYTELKNKT